METLYKLTTADGRTRPDEDNETQWGQGVTHRATGERGHGLCSREYIHAYRSPLLAVLMDPAHGEYGVDAVLWEGAGVVYTDDGTKVGCRQLTTVREIAMPSVTTEQRVRFGILAAKEACPDDSWQTWADGWLSGEDRSAAAARDAVRAAAEAARDVRVAWAARVARDARVAAETGRDVSAAGEAGRDIRAVAGAAEAAEAGRDAARAAWAARAGWTARAAMDVARAAAGAAGIDLCRIALAACGMLTLEEQEHAE